MFENQNMHPEIVWSFFFTWNLDSIHIFDDLCISSHDSYYRNAVWKAMYWFESWIQNSLQLMCCWPMDGWCPKSACPPCVTLGRLKWEQHTCRVVKSDFPQFWVVFGRFLILPSLNLQLWYDSVFFVFPCHVLHGVDEKTRINNCALYILVSVCLCITICTDMQILYDIVHLRTFFHWLYMHNNQDVTTALCSHKILLGDPLEKWKNPGKSTARFSGEGISAQRPCTTSTLGLCETGTSPWRCDVLGHYQALGTVCRRRWNQTWWFEGGYSRV